MTTELTPEDFVPDDFIMLRPALVRKMQGNVVGAMILTRIAYRCGAQHTDDDGHKWWRTNAADLAHEVGLSEPQVRRAINALIKDKLLASKVDNINGYDRTKTYRVNVLTSQLTKSSDGTDESVRSKRRNRQIEATESSVLPSIKTDRPKEKNNVDEEVDTALSDLDLPGSDATSRISNHLDDQETREDIELICAHFNKSLEARGCKPKRVGVSWRRAVRLMIDTDELTSKQIMDCIDWLTTHDFWSGVILSPDKLRAKYEQLRIQATSERNGSGKRHRAYQNPDHAAYFEEL